ncbi:Shikimate dehydrogenase [Planococcus massiliensis]|uniref:Shikimate dehydrogenase (NADP(+)) n=1 Tax=Planococcus massiliensis TaxID=1499687 RepID=A0A098EMI9_9BACL|nr:shikimate dehydrogenase [Planococcus massiliensis]CEG23025.1 Shikimate dehydrogenase [Planococcus massiliensis]
MKKWYAVIGDPIAHSLSPFMHDLWMDEHGVDASYIPVHVKPARLKESFDALKTLGVGGFNITLPHKQAIVPFLDELDETAIIMDAVNTVTFDGQSYKGWNTDGDGFVRSLMTEQIALHEKVLIIGAGGAARGIAFALKRANFHDVSIANRTYQRAEELAAATGSEAITMQDAEKSLGDFRIIIQTTSVGLAEGEALPLSLDQIQPDSLVADIIYTPLETPFLKAAKEKGCRILNGVGMFVYQGAIAFEKWTGIRPDTEKMIHIITDKLGGNYVNR